MNVNQLPREFEQAMKKQLSDSFSDFTQSLKETPPVSIRSNPYKNYSPKGLEKIKWSQYGKYLKERPVFTLDPLFHAGTYYVQEASSMFLEQAFLQTVDQTKHINVLDLCAAPGGKSTHLQSLLNKQSLLVSNEEAALFRARLLPQDRLECAVGTLRNGIDSELFDPARREPAAAMLACPGPRLIFSGQMDYAPNVAAAWRVIERLLPAIRQRFTRATFHVVGRNPPEALLAVNGKDGAYVWGAVDEMPGYLAAADLALVPLELARGVQNKVLEAMAMRLPVVLTAEAATGIGGGDGQHYLVGHGDAELIEQVCALLGDTQRQSAMGAAARHYVVDKLSWQATLAPLAAMLGLPDTAARDAA